MFPPFSTTRTLGSHGMRSSFTLEVVRYFIYLQISVYLVGPPDNVILQAVGHFYIESIARWVAIIPATKQGSRMHFTKGKVLSF